jgi:DNA-directed RNA polymerase subunit RPC12/RpoP
MMRPVKNVSNAQSAIIGNFSHLIRFKFLNCFTNRLKQGSSFRRHMKKQDQEGMDFFCSYCNKKYPNQDALRSHTKYVHLLKRTHQCSICDKAFKTAINLKEHIASHGSGQTLYECSVCSKTFNSNANMHSHRYFSNDS